MHVLLIEDNLADARLLKEACTEIGFAADFSIVEDGLKALDVLRRGTYAGAVATDLIILDLNLPKMGGLSVLDAIKSDRAIASIPVIVLSTSQREHDISEAARLGASRYLRKTMNFSGTLLLVREIAEFSRNCLTHPGFTTK